MNEELYAAIFFLGSSIAVILYGIWMKNRNFYEYYQDYDGPDQVLACYRKNLRTNKVQKVSRTKCMKNIGNNHDQWMKYFLWKNDEELYH